MTFGTFFPLLFLVIGVVDIAIFRWMLAKGTIDDGKFYVFVLASVMLPIVAYGVLNFAFPETGAIEVF